MVCKQNTDIFDDLWQRRTPTYFPNFKRGFDKKRVNCGVLTMFVLFLTDIPTGEYLFDSKVSAETRTESGKRQIKGKKELNQSQAL